MNVSTLKSASPTGHCLTNELAEIQIGMGFLNSLLKLLQLKKKNPQKEKTGFLRYHLKLLLNVYVLISVLPLVSNSLFFRCEMNTFIGR